MKWIAHEVQVMINRVVDTHSSTRQCDMNENSFGVKKFRIWSSTQPVVFSRIWLYIWFVFYYFLESILYSLVYNMNLFSAIKMGGGCFLWKHVATKCYHIFQCVFLNAKHDCRYHVLWELYKRTMYTKHKKIPYN